MKLSILTLFSLLIMVSCVETIQEPLTLKEAFKDDFYIGVALNVDQILGNTDEKTQATIQNQFNSVVPENCLKSMFIQPREGEFFFDEADAYVSYGEEHNMFIIGHALVWHSQAPDWIFVDDKGNDVSRDVLVERMKKHIYALAGRYKGRIDGWDVVNEAISDNADEYLRPSKWQQIIGDDFLELAFQFASEAAPEAELYYNDYNMHTPKKRNDAVKLIKNLQSKGIKISGVGMQAHYGLDTPLEGVDSSIVAFAELGIKVMVTELDITALPFPSEDATAEVSTSFEYQQEFNPYVDGLPADVAAEHVKKYKDLFAIYLKHKDDISRVTFWGLNDAYSWRNDWPIQGRTDYCLPFDRDNNPKAIVDALISLKTTK